MSHHIKLLCAYIASASGVSLFLSRALVSLEFIRSGENVGVLSHVDSVWVCGLLPSTIALIWMLWTRELDSTFILECYSNAVLTLTLTSFIQVFFLLSVSIFLYLSLSLSLQTGDTGGECGTPWGLHLQSHQPQHQWPSDSQRLLWRGDCQGGAKGLAAENFHQTRLPVNLTCTSKHSRQRFSETANIFPWKVQTLITVTRFVQTFLDLSSCDTILASWTS